MNAPKRIQRKREKGWRMPAGAVYVGMPSRWGNPFEDAYTFRRWLAITAEGQRLAAHAVDELRGYDLACWCRLDADCHADVLLEIANGVRDIGDHPL